jgi:ATP-dependent RNA helicase DHX37/DHR1
MCFLALKILGVLIRELQSDAVLSRYSVVIVDEAHERSVYSE